ncbi:unnamed protein product [Ascophyllum nodosum]
MPTILAGDIGGTSSRFVLYEVPIGHHEFIHGSRTPGRLVFQRTYANEYVPTFCAQVSTFLKDAGSMAPPETACIAIAGPVIHNKVVMTNRNWSIDGNEIAERFNIGQVRLVNDFVAAGYGLLTLDIDTECATLQEGEREQGAPIACIGSGTGLGETMLTCPVGGHVYDAWPTEGGHAEFAPRNDLDYELLKHIKEMHGITRVSVERVASGRGLVNVYDFLSKKYSERVDKVVDEAIQTAGDQKGRIISVNAHIKGSICEQVMETWASHYGCEAGAMGLRCIPTGGLFLAGGMTPKNISWLQGEDSPFMQSFYDKGRVSGLLKSVPIYAVLGEDLGLRGAHFVAYRMYTRRHAEQKEKKRAQKSAALIVTSAAAVAALSVILGVVIARARSTGK